MEKWKSNCVDHKNLYVVSMYVVERATGATSAYVHTCEAHAEMLCFDAIVEKLLMHAVVGEIFHLQFWRLVRSFTTKLSMCALVERLLNERNVHAKVDAVINCFRQLHVARLRQEKIEHRCKHTDRAVDDNRQRWMRVVAL